jgi:hypothetical protein
VAGRRTLGTIAALCLAACFWTAAPAGAAFVAPTFIRQWSAGSNPNQDVSGIDVDRSGRVYMLLHGGGDSFRVLRFRPDGKAVPGQWAKPIPGFTGGGLTTDQQGHVLIAADLGSQQPRLLEYTPDGGLLAAIPAKRLYGSALDVDRGGRVYATGRSASGRPSINEYVVSGAKSKVIASAIYPGTPSDDFFPANFFGLAVAPSGTVYASGASTASSFLARYEVGLGPPISYLEKCPEADDGCFGGFGLEVAATAFPPDPAQQMVYAAGGYGNGADPGNFYATGIYRTFGDPSQYQGSFNPAPLPASSAIIPFDTAGSPCGGLLYTLNSRFGGPGNTYDGVEVQEFDTHAPRNPCPPSPRAELSGLKNRYTLRVARHATSPCTPCAKLLPSGRYSNSQGPGEGRAAARRQRAGVTLRFRASAAADVTFTVKRVAGRGAKTSLGGFVFPARRGHNRVRFSGVLREGRPLSAGAYRVTASAGATRRHLRLRVLASR